MEFADVSKSTAPHFVKGILVVKIFIYSSLVKKINYCLYELIIVIWINIKQRIKVNLQIEYSFLCLDNHNFTLLIGLIPSSDFYS